MHLSPFFICEVLLQDHKPHSLSYGRGEMGHGVVHKTVSKIEFDFHSSIVLLFKNVFCGSKKDLILISSYIHPYGSPFYNNQNDNNGINLFENSFFKLYRRFLHSEYIITGDFNSRISNVQPCEELVVSDKYIENINTLSFFIRIVVKIWHDYRKTIQQMLSAKVLSN